MVSSIKVVSFLDLLPELRMNIYQYTAPKNEIVKYIAWARQMSIGLRPDSTIEFSATETLRNRIMPYRIFRSLCKTTRNGISHETFKLDLVLDMLDWDNIPLVEHTKEWKFPSYDSSVWKHVHNVIVIIWRQDKNEDSSMDRKGRHLY